MVTLTDEPATVGRVEMDVGVPKREKPPENASPLKVDENRIEEAALSTTQAGAGAAQAAGAAAMRAKIAIRTLIPIPS